MTDRSGSTNVHTVTANDPPYLFHRGESFERHRLPVGTTVVYPNDPLPAIADRRAAINHALDHPEGTDPLNAQLSPGMKVTVAFDDVSLPVPRMARPDIRQTIIEIVIERLERAGISDIELICAICLHRRCTPAELKYFVGPEVFRRFWPNRLYNHDAEDPDGNTYLGKTETGEEVELNRRAVESDMLIYVNVNLVAMDGGHKSVPIGLATYRSVKHHHNAAMLLHESSYMDPPRSNFHRSCERMGAVVRKHVNIFTIETTLNGDGFPSVLTFMTKREQNWNMIDRVGYHGMRLSLSALPRPLRRKAYNALPGAYRLAGIHAGETEAVHAKTLANVVEHQLVQVPQQYDIIIVGIPSLGPYNVGAVMNPILVRCMAQGYYFNFYRNRPLLRKGGVMILLHPLENSFHKIYHPSYKDFFEDLLPQTTDPKELEQKFEKSYAENERYIDLYRNSYAYHGVHPFYMWYWGAHGAAHISKVIAVNPTSKLAARRLEYEIAPTLSAAISKAKEIKGDQASLCYFHCPPIFSCDVP